MDLDIETGTEPWHDAKLLQQFRNEFMHFRPTYSDDEIHHSERGFIGDIKRKVKLARVWQGGFLFPYTLMTYDCARWAVRSVVAFSRDVSRQTQVRDVFAFIAPEVDSLP
jgi:hypothetical protein